MIETYRRYFYDRCFPCPVLFFSLLVSTPALLLFTCPPSSDSSPSCCSVSHLFLPLFAFLLFIFTPLVYLLSRVRYLSFSFNIYLFLDSCWTTTSSTLSFSRHGQTILSAKLLDRLPVQRGNAASTITDINITTPPSLLDIPWTVL
ncbi:uncharacterized protein BJX67DRAFT_52354 [Aspergillus lucknowensis]|uniref:Uncharacterized protein n=1 Tax=Aspergillus lucknowensis TaxID=176173 RepID=A0ABR4LUQ2_9EURO